MLHRWNTVCVVCRKGDYVSCAVGREYSHIEPNSHVHALLVKLWLEVRIRECSFRVERDLLWHETSELQFSAPNGEKFFASQLMKPVSCRSESLLLTRDW